jgi:hypothetical protein
MAAHPNQLRFLALSLEASEGITFEEAAARVGYRVPEGKASERHSVSLLDGRVASNRLRGRARKAAGVKVKKAKAAAKARRQVERRALASVQMAQYNREHNHERARNTKGTPLSEAAAAKLKVTQQKGIEARRARSKLGERLLPGAKATDEQIWSWLQKANIMDFARFMGYTFEGRPGQELALRLLHGLPLPEGRVKAYVRVPCDGFVLEPWEGTWLEYYTLLTGNATIWEEGEEPTEARICVGARGGKSTITALEALYQATRDKWKAYLGKHPRAYACILATSLQQARDVIQDAAWSMIEGSKLERFVESHTKLRIMFTNGLGVRSWPCNAKAPRGSPYFLTIYDEYAWFFAEGGKSDRDIHAAVDPRRAQFPFAKHVEITTPAAKQGRFYDNFVKGFRQHRTLTVKAPTWTFRPELHELDREFFALKFAEDPFNANREYGAEFDDNIQRFLPEEETCQALNLPGDVPPSPYVRYFAGIDASGLTGNDRFGFAICGRDLDRGRYIVPLVRSWTDKVPEPIVAEVRTLCESYGVRQVFTDQYARGWVHAALRAAGLEPIVCPTPSVVWTNLRKLVVGRQLDMPDNGELRSGLVRTQGAYSGSNRVTISHPRDRGGHADVAEGVAKAVYGASQEVYWGAHGTPAEEGAEAAAVAAEESYDPLTYGRV